MFILRAGSLSLAALFALGCGGSEDPFVGTGGTGGAPPIVEPGVTCTDFCIYTVGTCQAFDTSEEACRQGCQTNLNDEYAKSEACGMAVEAVFQCATALEECQQVYNWISKVPPIGYPCEAEVEIVGQTCPPPG
jgi:hypothetical protein